MDLLLHCYACNTGYAAGIVGPCPVCTQYGGIAPRGIPGVKTEAPPKKRKRGGSGGCVSPTIRLKIYRRDNFTCVTCGTPGGDLTIDHRIPLSKGGTNVETNLQTMCKACNGAKADSMPST